MKKLNSMENFKREILYQTLVREDKRILLTGTMKDCFHDIEVEIIVDSETLMISSARCDVKAAASSFCGPIEERIKLLEGVVIGKGLSRKLKETFSGPEGCGNLKTILIGLLPLTLNVKASLGLTDDKEILEAVHDRLQGTCVGYPVCKA